MTANITQKLNAIWFLAFGIFNHITNRGVEYLILTLIALICWHIIFADKIKKV